MSTPDIRVQFGSTALYDVTDRVRSVSISRGKSRELDRFQTGIASVVFDNRDRAFDPFYLSSPYYGDVRPRVDIIIETIVAGGTQVQFTGIVEDWNLDYDAGGDSVASAACADGFILFGGQQLEFGTATAEASGARVTAILDRPEVDWPSGEREIDTGASQFGADVIEQGRDVLEYLQLIEASELGELFMTRENKLAFRERNRNVEFADVEFSDDPSVAGSIPYTNIVVSYGTELLYNRAVVSNVGGTPQTQENTSSIATYGVSSLEINGLLVSTDSATDAIAEYLVNLYGEPELRIDSVGLQLAGLGTAQQEDILDLELNDIVRVAFTPNNIGDAISQELRVISMAHDIRPASHQMTIGLSAAGPVNFIFAGTADPSEYPFSVFAGTAGGTVYAGSPFGL